MIYLSGCIRIDYGLLLQSRGFYLQNHKMRISLAYYVKEIKLAVSDLM